MIAEADAAEGRDGIDFVRVLRQVADNRQVSVHDLLSPPPEITFVYDPAWGRVMPRITFDPYAGWSWREVLVWCSDAARAAREQEDAAASAQWRAQARQQLAAWSG